MGVHGPIPEHFSINRVVGEYLEFVGFPEDLHRNFGAQKYARSVNKMSYHLVLPFQASIIPATGIVCYTF